jgi:hypothetical protein
MATCALDDGRATPPGLSSPTSDLCFIIPARLIVELRTSWYDTATDADGSVPTVWVIVPEKSRRRGGDKRLYTLGGVR